ncbi:uncharacterized protein SPPG_08829 [Spizellomyces punctatus DAOM BR117]|uniref:Uncharacterized protein n=1 Tax=Spizellomyces punctatus (strain DAOM BR117) TaxID=645134 RepID=A0A0L0HU13_SPIPD|nr:uncharacterized protein SPPG_08829 [Spizellomyces punctatus DAOM BR117]KND04562.1 hypothetical protein SPPG_08829 [Spizellomyces punctatus DAOM BR117]|eukprot:XP_016612601.1 hypothetical protein SPPG_08829 [Spizellomyces punctatus DAOM BR117]
MIYSNILRANRSLASIRHVRFPKSPTITSHFIRSRSTTPLLAPHQPEPLETGAVEDFEVDTSPEAIEERMREFNAKSHLPVAEESPHETGVNESATIRRDILAEVDPERIPKEGNQGIRKVSFKPADPTESA